MANEIDFGELLCNFLSGRGVVIVDSSGTVRTAIASSLANLGVSAQQLVLAGSYDEAIGGISQFKTPIAMLISDYMIGNRSGIELGNEIFSNEPDVQKIAVFILTSSAHQSGVVEAAEGLADSYVLKPFSDKVLKKYMIGALTKKLRPSGLSILLQSMKTKYRAKDYNGMLTDLDQAIKSGSVKPNESVLPHILAAQAYEGLKDYPRSEAFYQDVLKLNAQNYTAIAGLYKIYSEQDQKAKAYQMLATIGKLFPLSPKRLCEAINLAVETRHFEDVEGYYQLFTALDERRDDLIKTMAAALVVGGIFRFQNKDSKDGINLFHKAIITSRRNPAFILKAISYCLCYEEKDSANKFFKMFEAENMESEQFQIAKFFIEDSTNQSDKVRRETNLILGVQLTQNKNCPVQVFRAVLRYAEEAGKDKLLKSLKEEALGRWPQKVLDRPIYDLGD